MTFLVMAGCWYNYDLNYKHGNFFSLLKVVLNILSGTYLEVGVEGGGLPCPFSKIGKKWCPNLEKKCPDFGHVWVKFLI